MTILESRFLNTSSLDEIKSEIEILKEKQSDIEVVINRQHDLICKINEENIVLKSKLFAIEFLVQDNPCCDKNNNSRGPSQYAEPNDKSQQCEQMININLPTVTPSRENNGMVISTNNCISDSSNNSSSTGNVIQHEADASLANSQFQPKPKNLVPCPFLRRRGYCLKGSRCDFLHNDTQSSTSGAQSQDRFHMHRHLIAAKIPYPLHPLFPSMGFPCFFPPYHPLTPPTTTPSTPLPSSFRPLPYPPPLMSIQTNEMFDKNFYMPRLLLTNVRSLIPKSDELEVVANVNEADIICITETWLTPDIPDSALSYSNFALFRNDRTVSIGGGVCILVNKNIFCKRLIEFENPNIESLWLSLSPRRLPRSISIILVDVVYHSTSSGASENYELYNHMQCNVDTFLRDHPDALVLVTPTSTGFNEKHVKRLSGLSQIVDVTTRENSILDWCLTNTKKLIVRSPH